jgi:hypothetical protein
MLASMGKRQRAGWALIAGAGVLSASIVAWQIADLVAVANTETSETLPVVGIVPVDDD